MIDEDHTDEIVTLGGDVVAVLRTGIEFAKASNRSAYVRGRINVGQFEAELERLMLKEMEMGGDPTPN